MQARELGARVALLEADQVGGTRLNCGPAPVRTLARAARLARDWSSWQGFGLSGPAPVPDLPAILAKSGGWRATPATEGPGAATSASTAIMLIEHIGPVAFTGPRTLVDATARTWTSGPGHRGRRRIRGPLPVPGAELALTYKDIPALTSLPGDGSRSSAVPTPAARSRRSSPTSGSKVTMFEAGPAPGPGADPAVGAA